jgi:DNA-binding phage protein
MKTRRPKTAFDRDLEIQLRDPEFARHFEDARTDIDATDTATNAFMRALDTARVKRGLSKAELARRIGAEPAVLRRLLSGGGQNPTLATLLKIASALRMDLELRDAAPTYRKAG